MKTKIFITVLALAILGMPAIAQKKKKKSKKTKEVVAVVDSVRLNNIVDSISYSMGVLFGSNLTKSGFDTLNSKLLARGLDESMYKKKSILTDEQCNTILRNYVTEKQTLKAKKNLAAGQAFLEKNKNEPGVVVLPSGLQYKIEKEGTGEKPGPEDKVTVNYHGTLIDGTVFDSSVERGQPIQLTVDGVIKGWTEALQLMPVGSKWKLFIPADLAYGDQQMSGSPIEPNSVLIFEVELISIDKE